MMDWLSSLIQFFTGMLTNSANVSMQRETNDLQRQLAEQTNQWSIQQWNRENAYNDPSAQRARLAGANLNPAMMYGNGGIMNEAGSSPALQMPTVGAPQITNPSSIDPLTGVTIDKMRAEIKSIKDANNRANELQPYNIQVLKERADNLHQQLQNLTLEGQKLGIDVKVANDTMESEIDALNKEFEARGANAQFTKAEAEEKLKYLEDTVKTQYETLKQGLDNKRAEFELLKKQGRLTDVQIRNGEKQIAMAEQEIENMKKLGEGYALDNKLKGFEVIKAKRDKKFYYVDKIFNYYTEFKDTQAKTLSAIGSIIPF